MPKVLAFDVFGTVVDWRGSVARETAGFLATIGRAYVDPAQLSDDWRMHYLRTVRDYAVSGRAFVSLDVLHREIVEAALRGIDVDPAVLDQELLAD
jgi:2-haloacid dehalogenase